MNKLGYGLNLRLSAQQKKQQSSKPPHPPPFGFNDEDEDNVEREISRQASKNKSLKDIEEQQKKALEEDPTVFDYDGVYDEMKQKAVLPRVQDREERKSRYIQLLKEKTKEREQYREVVFERKIAKERSKDDHLYADKDKFVTGAYKRKLAEQAKWMEEERKRELREAKEDVTKKSDLSDFYFNLGKNVAFGANDAELRKPEKQADSRKAERQPELRELEKLGEKSSASVSDKVGPSDNLNSPLEVSGMEEKHQGSASTLPERQFLSPDVMPATDASAQEETVGEQPSAEQPKRDHHKRNEDAVAAAKERFLARKKAKEQ
ncbi:nuclear speckle splicing regulatory protein 1-like [Juglans microcarpa x Juglans regia]|uniref:nuclear speckle splicing regulatory protein 1-like n=1 Tax=Juglans microcarpa x Juglans regia TaxID=2249226 RepID=UPI001B7F20C4|nr:nuclear speckle splicing regulatory protein 1-like [Juglans microcarpa x Juglans regia]XP_040994682.1 nuclear speckle splicing regulatory protein 1-like [Juglans microcarpa x Juglans regia]XP_040994683.1 nuclear speckle splicing regulatory protein 1-like [Juglans microcarpa x Juglans regia]XP_040994684.1 nuclear speckle splicing regulatory protein 1-like [Juglans microcarpa x Juglans regia]